MHRGVARARFGDIDDIGNFDRIGRFDRLHWPMSAPYTGRFAPSPTGPLHAGSLVAALASWLDARAHHGRWLLRFEDTDTPRTVPGADLRIVKQLAAHCLLPDAPPERQSDRTGLYADAADRLQAADAAYACDCSRASLRVAVHPALRTPVACRPRGAVGCALRVRTALPDGSDSVVTWDDRRSGRSTQNVTTDVGDFVLRRADGCWAYQLAVAVDDAAQGVTHVVRGADLSDNTARQIHLQRLLGLPTPIYLHVPLVLAADGQKLSKQTGAAALPADQPLTSLRAAAETLGLRIDDHHATTSSWLAAAIAAWRTQWGIAGHA